MKIAAEVERLLREHDHAEVYAEAARALEQAETHPFAVAREDVAWIAAALAIAVGVTRQANPGSRSVVHKVVMTDAINTESRLG